MKINCQCGQRIEIDDNCYGNTFNCPSCNTLIAVPEMDTPAKQPPTTNSSKPPTLAADIVQEKTRTKKQQMSIPQAICLVCIIFFVGWSILWFVFSILAFFHMSQSGGASGLKSNNQYEQAGTVLGFIFGFGLYFAIWLAGVIPAFIVFIFAKMSSKNK